MQKIFEFFSRIFFIFETVYSTMQAANGRFTTSPSFVLFTCITWPDLCTVRQKKSATRGNNADEVKNQRLIAWTARRNYDDVPVRIGEEETKI
jgi:hypothetical protein